MVLLDSQAEVVLYISTMRYRSPKTWLVSKGVYSPSYMSGWATLVGILRA
jgi:hypothetical protein